MAAFRFFSACFGVAIASDSFLKTRDSLPGVADILRKPTSALTELTSKVNALQTQISAVQDEGAQAVKKDKAKYEASLEMQLNENHLVARQNLKLDSDIKEIEQENQMLRDSATKLKKECAHINGDLNKLLVNISFAEEFTSKALEESARLLGNVPELTILQTLKDEDEKAQQARLHADHLSEVGSSFLQVSSKTQPEGLVESLGAALADLKINLNASRASLKEAFLKEWKDGENKHQALLLDQAKRNKTKAAALELREKLTVAVQHLQKTRKLLSAKDIAVKNYATLIGAGDAPKDKPSAMPKDKPATMPKDKAAAMLLQVGQETHSNALPEVNEVLSKPKQVMGSLSSQVESLQMRLAQVQQHGTSAIAAQKADYEEKLLTQRTQIAALSHKNKDTSARINALKEANLELRARARTLTKQGASLTSELQSLRTNVSTAQEFIENALSNSAELLLKAHPLQILKDLDLKDAEAAKISLHENRLNEVKSSFLQIRVDPAKPAAQLILDSLASAMDDLTKEQSLSAASLKAAFEQEFQAGEAQMQKLLKEKAELDASETTELKLKADLTAAVQHLEQARHKLAQQTQSLRLYMQRLGPQQKQ